MIRNSGQVKRADNMLLYKGAQHKSKNFDFAACIRCFFCMCVGVKKKNVIYKRTHSFDGSFIVARKKKERKKKKKK